MKSGENKLTVIESLKPTNYRFPNSLSLSSTTRIYRRDVTVSITQGDIGVELGATAEEKANVWQIIFESIKLTYLAALQSEGSAILKKFDPTGGLSVEILISVRRFRDDNHAFVAPSDAGSNKVTIIVTSQLKSFYKGLPFGKFEFTRPGCFKSLARHLPNIVSPIHRIAVTTGCTSKPLTPGGLTNEFIDHYASDLQKTITKEAAKVYKLSATTVDPKTNPCSIELKYLLDFVIFGPKHNFKGDSPVKGSRFNAKRLLYCTKTLLFVLPGETLDPKKRVTVEELRTKQKTLVPEFRNLGEKLTNLEKDLCTRDVLLSFLRKRSIGFLICLGFSVILADFIMFGVITNHF